MLKTNVKKEIKDIIKEENVYQPEIARAMKRSKQFINSFINDRTVYISKTLVNMMDVLGYDVEITFKKRVQGTGR